MVTYMVIRYIDYCSKHNIHNLYVIQTSKPLTRNIQPRNVFGFDFTTFLLLAQCQRVVKRFTFFFRTPPLPKNCTVFSYLFFILTRHRDNILLFCLQKFSSCFSATKSLIFCFHQFSSSRSNYFYFYSILMADRFGQS